MVLIRRRKIHLLFSFLTTQYLESAHAQTTTSAVATARAPRITDPEFIGYTSNGDTWSANYCPGSSTWWQTSTWGRCCPTASDSTPVNCAIFTECVDTSIIIQRNGNNATCTGRGNSICRTATISQNEDNDNPFIYVGCGTQNWTAFRTPPAAVIQTLTQILTQTEGGGDIPTATGTGTGTSAAPTQENGGGGGGGSSKAWIAGAVVGPIAFAVIAGLLYYIWRLKKSPKEDPSAAPMMGPQPAFSQGQGQAYYPQDGQYAQTTQYPYQQPFDQHQTGYYAPVGANKSYSDQYHHTDTPAAPIELGSGHEVAEVPAEPTSPKRPGAHDGNTT